MSRDKAGIEATQQPARMPAITRQQKARDILLPRALKEAWPCWNLCHGSDMTYLSPSKGSCSWVVKLQGSLDHEDTSSMG